MPDTVTVDRRPDGSRSYAQGFGRKRPTGRVDRRHLRRVLDHIGLIQIDSVNVLVRSQELPLFARLGAHPRTLIPDATADGELFEYWVHEACHVPVEQHPLYRWAMDEMHPRWKGVRGFAAKRPDFIDAVSRPGARRGPDRRRRPPQRATARRASGGTGTTARLALEYLFRTGDGRRAPTTERLRPPLRPGRAGDPAERPRRADADRDRGQEGTARPGGEVPRGRHRRRPRGLPPAQSAHAATAARRTRRGRPARRGRRRGLGASRHSCTPMRTCRVGCAPVRCSARSTRSCGTGIAPSDCSASTTGSRSTCPKPKRVYGYYVLPFLLGDDLVARVDLKADRDTGRLLVQGAFAEPGVAERRRRRRAARRTRRDGGLAGARCRGRRRRERRPRTRTGWRHDASPTPSARMTAVGGRGQRCRRCDCRRRSRSLLHRRARRGRADRHPPSVRRSRRLALDPLTAPTPSTPNSYRSPRSANAHRPRRGRSDFAASVDGPRRCVRRRCARRRSRRGARRSSAVGRLRHLRPAQRILRVPRLHVGPVHRSGRRRFDARRVLPRHGYGKERPRREQEARHPVARGTGSHAHLTRPHLTAGISGMTCGSGRWSAGDAVGGYVADTIAQRSVCVTASPTARPRVASLTGSQGRRSGQRVHTGISETDAAAISP